ncbi:DUF4040 family protein [Gephyromycinifex aptenodytis]|uniref:DUF4040 family protein n=1 Tax=Gephyromycinifex aptenodytis TaxID=2716227 RepID=UPI00144811AC|nr:DUF4040 family protein [Gephyromycinifex aptenodytis]
MTSMTLPYTVLLLVAGVIATPVLTATLRRNTGWVLAAVYLAAAVVFLPAATEVLNGGIARWSMPWVPSLGVALSLRADGLGVVFTFIALIIGAVVLSYSSRYLEAGPQHRGFFLVMASFTASMVGLVLADDLFLLFICWELTSLASFLLVAQGGRGGQLASLRTLFLTFVGGLTLLVAVALIVARTGTTTLSAALADPIWGTDPGFTAAVASLVLIAGFTKSAQFPFHVWLPDAMAASTPVSAYLHAAAVVKAGIFLLMRFSPAFHATPVWNICLITVGLFTATLGAWFALQQLDLKKLMAYSTVSQLGLIVATIGVGTQAALTAAVLHTIAHALFKSGLFMMVGVIDHAVHTRDLRRLPPLAKAMPLSFAVTALGAASMAGIPPLLGFVSKESLLGALHGAPGPAWAGWAALLVAGFASILTFAYCTKIVFGAYLDGTTDPAERPVHRPEALMLLPASLPILASVPLGLMAGVLDNPLKHAVRAALFDSHAHPHLALWHGITAELLVTLAIFTVGAGIILTRKRLFASLERSSFPFDGAEVIAALAGWLRRAGLATARLVEGDNPSRHLAPILALFAFVLLPGVAFLIRDDGLPAPVPGLSQPIDLVIFVLISGAVLLACAARARLAAVIALSTVGVLATTQILALGAPDVALTQLLVEVLTVIVIMLVLQKLPTSFGPTPPARRLGTGIFAVIVGLAAGAGTWAFSGRRPRSELAQWYLRDSPEVSGGSNIVNVILVEFRAFDTLGELAVLGMTGIALIAVLSTVLHRDLAPLPTPAPASPRARLRRVATPGPALRAEHTPAYRAINEAWGNVLGLQLMVRVVGPLLILVSAVLFWRGHSAPGGGFIAALVASSIVGLMYLSTSRDRQMGPPRLPLFLIGGGIMLAILTGLGGLVLRGSFLEPIHGHVGHVHLTSAMIFDAGVYIAVLGLIMVAFNLLGTSESSSDEGTRERVDEIVEGELPGPLSSVRGERPPARPKEAKRRVGVGTAFLAHDRLPREVGRDTKAPSKEETR